MATTHTSTGDSYHGTTDGSAVDDITLDRAYGFIEVVNRDATTDITFQLATGVGDNLPALTVGRDGSVLVRPGASYVKRDDTPGFPNPASRVQVLSSVAAAYSIYGSNG
jgi:hypothetical protein